LAEVAFIEAPPEQLETEGLIRRQGDVIEVVENARSLVRTVAAAFDVKPTGSDIPSVTAV